MDLSSAQRHGPVLAILGILVLLFCMDDERMRTIWEFFDQPAQPTIQAGNQANPANQGFYRAGNQAIWEDDDHLGGFSNGLATKPIQEDDEGSQVLMVLAGLALSALGMEFFNPGSISRHISSLWSLWSPVEPKPVEPKKESPWQYCHNNKWLRFDAEGEAAEKLEAAYSKHQHNLWDLEKTKVKYSIEDERYVVDFKENPWRQRSEKQNRIARLIRRLDANGSIVDNAKKEGKVDSLNDAWVWGAFKQAMEKSGHAMKADAKMEDVLDYQQTKDYRDVTDTGNTMTRGGKPYKLPVGYKRFAVKVSGKFDGGDNTWMKMTGKDEGEWAVAYHGTNQGGFMGILNDGFTIGTRHAHEAECGKGIYCAAGDDLEVAEFFADQARRGHETIEVDGVKKKVRFILQCRVKPSAIKVSNADTCVGGKPHFYWVINDPKDVRPYGILVKEVE